MKQAKKPAQAAVAQQIAQEEETQVSQGDNDLDQEPAFNEIDKLEQFGINAADIGKLKGSGICTVLAVLMWYVSFFTKSFQHQEGDAQHQGYHRAEGREDL